jgi:predicted DNA-binding transcriptional regulator AlpA
VITQEFLRPKEAAAVLGMTAGALASMRFRKEGPPYTKVGKRFIRYAVADIREYMERHKPTLKAA